MAEVSEVRSLAEQADRLQDILVAFEVDATADPAADTPASGSAAADGGWSDRTEE